MPEHNRAVVLLKCFTAYQMRKFHARFGFELLDDDLDPVLVILICLFKALKVICENI